MSLIDLHAHTKLSDGTSTVAEVVYTYNAAGVEMMSLTDHDCIDGLAQARKKAQEHNILFVNGVEISTREMDHLHFLGFNIDPENKNLQQFLAKNVESRTYRTREIIKKLQNQGLDISEEDVFRLVKKVPSRAHIADCLRNKGYGSSRQDVFRHYLIKGCPSYVPSMGATAQEAISVIKEAAGKCFIAHAGLIKDNWSFDKWVSWGLDGIEVYYPSHHEVMRNTLLEIVKKYNLLISGGTDFHGKKSGRCIKPGMEVPQEVFDKLQETFFKD